MACARLAILLLVVPFGCGDKNSEGDAGPRGEGIHGQLDLGDGGPKDGPRTDSDGTAPGKEVGTEKFDLANDLVTTDTKPPILVDVTGTVEKHLLGVPGASTYDIERLDPPGIQVFTIGLTPPVAVKTILDGKGQASYTLKGLPDSKQIQIRAVPDDPKVYLEGRSPLFTPKDVLTKPLVLFLFSKQLLQKLGGAPLDPTKGALVVYVEDGQHKPVSGATVDLWSTGTKLAPPLYPKADFMPGSATSALYPVAVFVNLPLPPNKGTYTVETKHPKLTFSDQSVQPVAGVVVVVAPD